MLPLTMKVWLQNIENHFQDLFVLQEENNHLEYPACQKLSNGFHLQNLSS